MKYLKQFMIIAGFTFLGEVIHDILGLPVPAGIYGLVILLILLETGVMKAECIKEAAEWLLAIMTVLFLPPAVSIYSMTGTVKLLLLPIVLAGIAVTFLVFGVTGRVSQFILERGGRPDAGNAESAEESHVAETVTCDTCEKKEPGHGNS